jgi:putative membrane protein
MKHFLKLWLLAISSCMIMVSCTNNDEGNTTTENNDPGSADSLGAGQTNNNNVANDEAEFISEAYYDGMKEIEAGKLAQQKGQAKEVKDLAAMMVKDHTEMGEKLKALAASKNIALKESLSQEDLDEIRNTKKTGKDFDRWYAAEMVDDHEDAVEDFEKQSKDAKDPEIKALATEGLPKLQHHLEMSKTTRDKVKG